MNAAKGCLAYCGKNELGLILSEAKEVVEYPDGTTGEAWTGIHLTGNFGAPWSSRNPLIVGKIDTNTGTVRALTDGKPKFLPDSSVVLRLRFPDSETDVDGEVSN